MRRTSLMLVMAATLVGCGGPTKVVKKNRSGADPAKARVLVNEAKSELEEGEFAAARKHLDDANRLSDEKIRHQIEITTKAIDKKQARKVASDIEALSKDGKCLDGAKKSAKISATLVDTEVPKRLRKLTKKSLVACVDELLAQENFSDAQAFVAAKEAQSALDTKTVKKLKEKVHETVLDAMLARITAPLAERKWADGTAILVKATKDGEALPAERDEVLEVLRKGIAEDVKAIVNDRFGKSKGGLEALAKVDALLVAGFYKSLKDQEKEEDQKADSQDERLRNLLTTPKPTSDEPKKPADPHAPTEPVPEELKNLRREMAMWVTCQLTRCKVATPAAMWLYGNAPLAPPFAPKEAALRELRHGRQVWRLATAGRRMLVSRTEPTGNMAGLRPRAPLAWGWVDAGVLKTSDTAEWLPPGNAIIGTRVWGPLRDGDKKYELGTVTGVDGSNIQVQRLADRDVMVVGRAALHFGIVKEGLKVLAFCEPTKQQAAVVESVKLVKHQTQGDSRVVVRCLDDSGKPGDATHEDNFGALRIKPEWLPRRR